MLFSCPVKPPVIVVKPPERMHVYTGLIFLLPCQASGMPPPRIQWYKNGEQLAPDKPRTSVLSSGELPSGDCTKGEVRYWVSRLPPLPPSL